MANKNPFAIFVCPYCLGNQDSDNVLIFCRVCKGTGKVTRQVRDYWRYSLPNSPYQSDDNNSLF